MEKDLIVTLDDNKKYVIVSILEYQNNKYLYLSDIDDFKNIIIGKVENDEIDIVEDEELLGTLYIEFSKILNG